MLSPLQRQEMSWSPPGSLSSGHTMRAAGEMEASYGLKLGRRCTRSLDAGRDSHMNHRPRRTPPLVVYIQNVQGYQ
jgi:hypothetical protein